MKTSKIVNSVDDADHIGRLQVLLSPAPILLSTASIHQNCVHTVRRDLRWDTDLWKNIHVLQGYQMVESIGGSTASGNVSVSKDWINDVLPTPATIYIN